MHTVLVTGAAGFVGSSLCAALRARGAQVHAAVRSRRSSDDGDTFAVGDIDGDTDWRAALAGCDCVVHLAARVHVLHDSSADPLALYRRVNVEASVALARQAAAMGVKRFVFVSSIKVNGEASSGAPFRASDPARPLDPYGQSKLEAETALRAVAADTGMALVIVRPPLVYGPGVKANFLQLIKLVARGWPLPFGSVRNARSMVALPNLVDLLLLCTRDARAAGAVLLVSDGRDLTIGELATLIGRAMGQRVRLLPVPVRLMRAGAALLGKRALAQRLLGSLQVDIGATCERLDWHPPVSVETAIAATVAAWREQPGPPA
ncbi:MAG TPA: SDR family oxidoreductase [Telluria sp.]|jgi:UDP-glucose 4-epimerase